jgi:Mce-associated membrane protein
VRRAAWWAVVITFTMGIVVALLLGGWQLFVKRTEVDSVADQPSAREAVLQVANTNVPKLLTYSASSAEHDMTSAQDLLTGDFLEYYKRYTHDVAVKTAQARGQNQSASVVGAAIETLTTNSASVLAFVNQTTTTRDQPAPQVRSSAIRIGMTKVRDEWLISRFDPL